MVSTVFVSRLGEILRERRLDVDELERRMRERGHDVSRSALRRLATSRPVRTVPVDMVVPLLRELGVDFGALFRPVGAEDGRPKTRRERIGAADAELVEITARLDEELRRQHPERYDQAGRPKPGALEQFAIERSGGKRYLTDEDLLALDAKRRAR